jgi:hypothetical protein
LVALGPRAAVVMVYEAITINCFLQIMLHWVGRAEIVALLGAKDMRTVCCPACHSGP